ncbi:hypothetical protein [Sphingomonas sp.]|uniref:hypothetical protein n=1 Tax=Sphingomonas sp. TaxID=28214 RepID=UPI0025E74253|nr:hypothetical protein [Sphingomonas sp.]
MPSYASMAKLVLGAPLVIDARVKTADRVKPQDAPGLAAGRARFYVVADVAALIRGRAGLPAQISFLADIPLDSKGKPPRMKKARLLLFARAIAGQADQVQLTGIDSQRGWSPGLDAMVRGIVKEVLAADAPPEVDGVGNAFSVPGALPGERETQIFVTTRSGAPFSIQVLRRPGEQPRWSVSLGDIVDDSAGAPKKDTLLWYRLACGLPRQLPEASVAGEDPANARAAREDYGLVIRDLGACA